MNFFWVCIIIAGIVHTGHIAWVGEKVVHKVKPVFIIHHNAKPAEVRKWLDSLGNTIPDSTRDK